MNTRYWNSFWDFCKILGLITLLVGANIIYRQFVLEKKVVMIATNDFPSDFEEEGSTKRK